MIHRLFFWRYSLAGLVVKPYNFRRKQKAQAEEVNEDFDVLYELLNGGIDNDNISEFACIDMDKINWGSCDPCAHASRHCLSGADPLPPGCIDWSQIDSGSVPDYFEAGDGRLSKPAWDSGWVSLAYQTDTVLSHNLAVGDPDTDLLVYAIGRETSTKSTPWGSVEQDKPNNIWIGTTDVGSDIMRGYVWKNLDADHVSLYKAGGKSYWNAELRIFVWKLV